MTIKRYTFEIDDSSDINSSTGSEIQQQSIVEGSEINQTQSVEKYINTDTSKTDDLLTNKRTVGRTLADIVVEFKDDPRFMTIILTMISFIIFVTKSLRYY
jgi:hypothetical protein